MDRSTRKRDGPHTPSMNLPTNDNEKRMTTEEARASECDRLMEEINILRLEGALFCFDPRQAKKRRGPLTLTEARERPVTIHAHPDFGQPSVLAYKVMQAIFLKMTEEGYPYPEVVSFSQRELARLVGRSGIGGNTSKQLFEAMMQLRSTMIFASIFDKEVGEWSVVNFSVLSNLFFSGRRSNITTCSVYVDRVIAQSVNKRHIAFFNLHRLNTLDAVGVVLYKRIFFHLSNLYHPQKGKERLSFEKDYEDLCAEWLGGLKPEKYRSKILQNQLGRHLDALKKTQLIRKYDVCRKADGSGFKIVFHPGDGFFDDYEEYYLRLQQPRLRFKEAHSVRLIQKPLELVAYFHEKVGHSGNTFSEKDTAQASKLLETYSESDVRDLIDFALDHARSTKFQMQHFGAVLTYLDRWAALLATRVAQSKRRQEIEACVICDESGYIQVKDRSGAFRAAPCPHNAAKLTEFEERTGLRRV